MSSLMEKQESIIVIHQSGKDLMSDPTLNKGTAFSEEERTEFNLDGMLPPVIETLEQQCVRAYEAYKRKDDHLERHIFLRALQDKKETFFYALFYRLIVEWLRLSIRQSWHRAPSTFHIFTV